MKYAAKTAARTLIVSFLGIVGVAFISTAARASIVYYTTQSAFNAAAPGVSVALPSGSGVATGPLTLATGLSVNTTGGGSQNLIYEGGIAPNFFGDTLVLDFSPAVTAVGVEVEGQYAGSSTTPAALISDVYTQGSSNATKTSPTIAADTPYFFGITSTVPITSVSFLFDSQEFDAFTEVSSVQYGNTSVPESGSMLLLTSAALLAFYPGRARKLLP